MKKSSVAILLSIIFVLGTLLTACGGNGGGTGGANGVVERKSVLKIGNAPYDYEVPIVEIATLIAKEQGYEVEVVKGDVGFMFLALTKGDIDAWPGLWLPAIHASYHEKYSDQYELGGAIFEDAPTGWVVPKYVELDSIADIKGNEDVLNGKFTGFEPGSGMMLVSQEIIKGYDLDLELVSGTSASMMAEADYAITHNEPIAFLGWRPHTMFRKYDLKMLEDPKGYWEMDDYLWGFDKGFKEKAPDMHRFFNNLTMSIDDVEDYLYSFHEEKQDRTELAEQWIADHRADIDAWLGK